MDRRGTAWISVALASLACLAAVSGVAAAQPPGLVWDAKEAGVKLLLKHASNVTATEEGAEADHSCVAFLFYRYRPPSYPSARPHNPLLLLPLPSHGRPRHRF